MKRRSFIGSLLAAPVIRILGDLKDSKKPPPLPKEAKMAGLSEWGCISACHQVDWHVGKYER